MARLFSRISLKTILVAMVSLVILTIIALNFNNNQKTTTTTNSDSKIIEISKIIHNNDADESEWNTRMDAKLQSNMERAWNKNLDKYTDALIKQLPNPSEIVKVSIGPVKKKLKKESKLTVLQRLTLVLDSLKCSSHLPNKDLLLLIGRPGSGLDQFASVLHRKHGVFVLHEDTLIAAKDVIYSLTNLSRCAVSQTSILDKDLENSALRHNSFIVDSCDDKCMTSPELWTQMCKYFTFKAIASETLSLDEVRIILQDHQDHDSYVKNNLNVIYITRDPRAILQNKLASSPNLDLTSEAENLCNSLQDDLSVIDHKLPKFRFFTLRYEEFAMRLEDDQVSNYLKGFHTLSKFCSGDNKIILEETSKYSDSVDSWKQKLTMENIIAIEDKCTHVLTRMEYPIYGSNFGAAN